MTVRDRVRDMAMFTVRVTLTVTTRARNTAVKGFNLLGDWATLVHRPLVSVLGF